MRVNLRELGGVLVEAGITSEAKLRSCHIGSCPWLSTLQALTPSEERPRLGPDFYVVKKRPLVNLSKIVLTATDACRPHRPR